MAGYCRSCQVLMINGHGCHETGCPDAWKSHKRKCKCCGKNFTPKERRQEVCSQSCYRSYWG